MQSDQVDYTCKFPYPSGLYLKRYSAQLAALQLIERGLLHVDDPVSKYVPEFTNLIVLDDVMKEEPSYTPAKEIVTVKHLLNFTCGLFYPLKYIVPGMQLVQYSAPHNKDDPIGEFFRLVKVRGFVLSEVCKMVILGPREIYPVFHSNSSPGQIVSNTHLSKL